MNNKIFLARLGGGRYALRLDKTLAMFKRQRTGWYNTIKGTWQRERAPECETTDRDGLVRIARIQAAVKKAELSL